MQTPFLGSSTNQNLLLKTSGGALPQEDGTVVTGGVLDEPLFEPRQVSFLWQPGSSGTGPTLRTVILEDDPAPGFPNSTIQEPGGVYHYSASSGFLLYSYAQDTNTFQYTTVIWNRPDLSSDLVALYKTGDEAPGMPGVTIKFPAPSLLTANRDGSYLFTASLEGAVDASQSFAAWARIGGATYLIHQNNNSEAGVLGVTAPVIGGGAVLFEGNLSGQKAYVKWEGGHQRLLTREYGTLVLGQTNEVPTRLLGGKAIDDNGRVLFHHQTNTVEESLIREGENGQLSRLISKGDTFGDATIISFKDIGSGLARPLLTPDGRAVFLATFRRPGDTIDQTGIWRQTQSGFEQLVDSSKPEQLIDFNRFTSIANEPFDVDDPMVGPDGRIAFYASFGNPQTMTNSTNDATTTTFRALFAEDSAGKIHLVARTGQEIQAVDLFGGTDIISTLTGANRDSNNRVGFRATLVRPGYDVSFVATFGEPALGQPEVQIRRENGEVIVTWDGQGVLEQAPSPNGPWAEVVDAISPYHDIPAGERYYRVRRN